MLADRDRRATDFPNVWFPEAQLLGAHPGPWGDAICCLVGAGILALRSLPEGSLVLTWLVYTPRVLYNPYRPGSRYQSRQANSAKQGH